MKLLFSLLLTFCFATAIGQTNWRDTTNWISPTNRDTCNKIDSNASLNLVTRTRHPQPLYIANDIIVSAGILRKKTSLIENISVLKCPDAFNKFGYIGYNGAIIISTTQSFETVTPKSIRQNDFSTLNGEIIFALNGDVIKDSTMKISSKSIKQIELLRAGTIKGENKDMTKYNCINIWTLTEAERKPTARLCRGIRFTQN
jgi:hypothetical protein